MFESPLEKLRRIWSPGREVEEVLHELGPQTQLDSMIRDYLHRVVEQKGPVTLILGHGDVPYLNTGTLRFEVVHHEPRPGVPGRREVSLWVDGAVPPDARRTV